MTAVVTLHRREWYTNKDMATDHRQEYTVNEAAAVVGISPNRLREWIARKELPVRRAGAGRSRGTILITRADLLAFRRRHQRNPNVRAGLARARST